MTLFQMEVLVAVSDNGSFTRAGDKIGLSQSGVSHTIGALEKELGIALFNRSRSGISLTAAGVEAVACARVILEQTSRLKQLAVQSPSQHEGIIRIGSFPSAATALLPPLLRSLGSLYPKLETRLFEGTYQEVAEWIRSGVVDAGFLVWPLQDLEGSILVNDPLKVVLPVDHPLAAQSVLTLEQLGGKPFIMPMAGCEEIIQSVCNEKGVTLDVRHEVADNATILRMVEAGIGIAVVPALTLPEALPDVTVLPLEPPLHRQIGLAVHSLAGASPSVLAVIREAQRLLTH